MTILNLVEPDTLTIGLFMVEEGLCPICGEIHNMGPEPGPGKSFWVFCRKTQKWAPWPWEVRFIIY